jgi:hypothetical protein
MHPNILKDRFIELRSKNLSLARIATEIGVSVRTLVDWNAQCQPELRALRAAEREALHERIVNSTEVEWTRLANLQNRLEAEIDRRCLTWTKPEKLVSLFLQVRREMKEISAEFHILDNPPPPPPPAQNPLAAIPVPLPPNPLALNPPPESQSSSTSDPAKPHEP